MTSQTLHFHTKKFAAGIWYLISIKLKVYAITEQNFSKLQEVGNLD